MYGRKLTAEQAKEIHEMYHGSRTPIAEIARQYDVSRWTIYRIAKGDTYKEEVDHAE